MILLAWNPKDNSKMALPPCHCIAHFDVSAKINGIKENCLVIYFKDLQIWGWEYLLT